MKSGKTMTGGFDLTRLAAPLFYPILARSVEVLMPKIPLIPWMVVLLLALVGGCVHRTITVRSDPPDALVYLNDQEVGRTPFTREFTWYGTYDVELRKEGYQSIKTTAMVWAPWWQWVPIDLFTEALPLEDHHELSYKLAPPTTRQTDPELLLRRGEDLRGELMASEKPTTQPTTRPTTKPTTKPAKVKRKQRRG